MEPSSQALQLNPKQAEGIDISVYAPKAASANAGDFAVSAARAAIIFRYVRRFRSGANDHPVAGWHAGNLLRPVSCS
jgi:hypothetical protein